MSRRLLAATASAMLTLPLLAGALGSSAVADDPAPHDPAPPSAAPFRLVAPSAARVESYDNWVYLESLGVVKAQHEPLELRARRPSYRSPVEGVWRRADGDVALPAGSVTTLGGLDDFASLVVRNRAGRVVERLSMDTCLNGWSQRLSPDAPARSPYPQGCAANAYALGTVMGVQEGWGMALGAYQELRLRPGTYKVAVQIEPQWRDFFAVTGSDARTVTKLTVVRSSEGRRPQERPGPTLRPAQRPSVEAAGSTEPRPDLRSLPAWDISVNKKSTLLRFAANVWNAGDSPLVLDGYREPDEDHMQSYQYFFDSAGEQVGYQLVGEMHFHGANHNHWHFEDFARYRLLDAKKQPVSRSAKQSFCLAATDAIDYTVPGADWQPENTDLSTACGGPQALAIRQALPSGSGDTYHQYRAGQAINIEGLPNGRYFLAVEANPFGTLVEADTTNNVALRKIWLGGRPGARWVKVPQVGLIDEDTMMDDWGR